MQGFVGFTIPIWLRRFITMLPAILVAAIGVNPTETLLISQVILSFALPFPVIALIIFTSRKSIMGNLVNSKFTASATTLCAAIILGLNVWLLYSTFAPLFGWWMPH